MQLLTKDIQFPSYTAHKVAGIPHSIKHKHNRNTGSYSYSVRLNYTENWVILVYTFRQSSKKYSRIRL